MNNLFAVTKGQLQLIGDGHKVIASFRVVGHTPTELKTMAKHLQGEKFWCSSTVDFAHEYGVSQGVDVRSVVDAVIAART